MQPYTPDRSLFGKLRRRITRRLWRHDLSLDLARPTVSFTFDDIPASAALTGARILEAAGVRGTFYVCAGLFGRDGHMGRYANEDEIAALIRDGHEIAGHTYSHVDCYRTRKLALEKELDTNDAILSRMGASIDHFAYPYGELSPRSKRQMSERYASMRGVHKGLVTGLADMNQLPAVGIEGEQGEATARRWIDQAVAQKAWLILYTHDVREEASNWGCTPEALRSLVEYAKQKGCEIRTIGQVVPQ